MLAHFSLKHFWLETMSLIAAARGGVVSMSAHPLINYPKRYRLNLF